MWFSSKTLILLLTHESTIISFDTRSIHSAHRIWIWNIFYIQYSYVFWDNWTNWMLCIYFQVSILNKKFWKELTTYFPWYDTGHIENDAFNNSSTVACVFITVVRFLPSRCLATIGGFLPSHCLAKIRGFLPSRCLATTGRSLPSHCLATIRGFLPSCCLAMIGGHLPSHCLATIGGIHRHTHTHTKQCDLISLLLFFQNKESRLKITLAYHSQN
jgi:hypothetical protein